MFIPGLSSLIQVSGDTPQNVAKAFFLSKWVQGIYQQYVPALYGRRGCSAALKTSVEAVGLAALSIERREAGLMTDARRSHAVALKEIKNAVKAWEPAKTVDTLAAIMLLALFAGIASEPDAARNDWATHIKGASTILNSRLERTRDDNPVVNVISSHVTSCVLVHCLQNAVRPPKQFREIKFEPRIPVSFQGKSEYVLELLAGLKQRVVSIETYAKILTDLDIVDSHLNDLLEVLPMQHPRTINPATLDADDPPLHTYPSQSSARVWNIIRLTKLSAFELRYEKVKKMRDLDGISPHVDCGQQLEYASSSAATMIRDICASVPKRLRSTVVVNEMDFVSWSRSLLWPLSAARASPHAPESLRPFLRRQLQILWNITQLPIADYHQKDIEDGVKPHVWTHVLLML